MSNMKLLFPLFLSLSSLLFSSFIPSVHADASFSFSLTNPIQCQNMTVDVSGGSPPYQLVIIPSGTVEPETRRILSFNFSSTSYSFKLDYPKNSNFVALMSDSTGVGTGGTGVANPVASSNDDSCLKVSGDPKFFFYLSPTVNNNQLSQCGTYSITWDTTKASGHVTLYGVIPGGESFRLDQGTGTSSTSYSWTVNVATDVSVTLIAGDDDGPGTGGSVGPYQVTGGNQNCLNADTYSSTAGSPAGGIQTQTLSTYTTSSGTTIITATSSSGSGGGGGGSSGSSTGAIVGGVIGGVVGLTLITGLIFFFLCIRPKQKREEAFEKNQRDRVDLTAGEGYERRSGSMGSPPTVSEMTTFGAGGAAAAANSRGGFYHNEPFVVPEVGSSGRASTDLNHSDGGQGSNPFSGAPSAFRSRRQSQQSMSKMSNDPSHAGTLATTNMLGNNSNYSPTSQSSPGSAFGGAGASRLPRKGPHPPSALRATNLVQHEDAEVAARNEPEEEVVELPPMYSDLRSPPHDGNGQ